MDLLGPPRFLTVALLCAGLAVDFGVVLLGLLTRTHCGGEDLTNMAQEPANRNRRNPNRFALIFFSLLLWEVVAFLLLEDFLALWPFSPSFPRISGLGQRRKTLVFLWFSVVFAAMVAFFVVFCGFCRTSKEDVGFPLLDSRAGTAGARVLGAGTGIVHVC